LVRTNLQHFHRDINARYGGILQTLLLLRGVARVDKTLLCTLSASLRTDDDKTSIAFFVSALGSGITKLFLAGDMRR
jgi:hypothetical protein